MVIAPSPSVDLHTANIFYEDFFRCDMKADKPGDVSIGLFFGQIPDTKGMMVLLENDSSWSMFRSGHYHLMRFDRKDSGKSYMVARFDPAVETVSIFCSDDFVIDGKSSWNPVQYPLDQILLMYHLSSRDGAIVHAAGTVISDRGFLFPGRSGSGKTTISQRLAKAGNTVGLSDDRIIVRKVGETFMMFGTPWPGDAGMAVNKSGQLSGIFFLQQSNENRIDKITDTEAFKQFMPVLSIPWYDREPISGIFSFIEDLISQVPSYILNFTPDIEVDLFEEFVSRK